MKKKQYLYKNIKIVAAYWKSYTAYYYNPETKTCFALCGGYITARAALIAAKRNIDFLNCER